MIEELVAAFVVGVFVGSAWTSTGSDGSADSVTAFLDERREEIRSSYEEGRISHGRFASEIEIVEDPATEEIMYAVSDVDGIGPAIGFEIAREYRSVDELASASTSELESVNRVGENRARAITSRVSPSKGI
jgi:ERCC4-type nuclease